MKDTVELLKECDAGLIMATDSLEKVMEYASAGNFSNMLHKYYDEHQKIKADVSKKLSENNVEGKKPNVVGRTASKGMTEMKLIINDSDQKIADLMMDGCNMGIKSVSRYMNQYPNSQEDVKQIANNIITLEQNFVNELRQYL